MYFDSGPIGAARLRNRTPRARLPSVAFGRQNISPEALNMIETSTSVDRSFGIAADFDVGVNGDWVGLFRRGNGSLHVESSLGFHFSVPMTTMFPCIRSIGDNRILVVDSRTRGDTPNGHIFSDAGEVLASFSVGDGVEDVVVLETGFAVTYFDEGVFGGRAPSSEGVAFFGFDGHFSWGYSSGIGSGAVDIADCYCACRVGRNQLAFCPYTGFPLVELNLRTRVQKVDSLPEEMHGASALSKRRQHTLLYGPYSRKHGLFRWTPGEPPFAVGNHSGPLRGLDGGRFLSKGEHGFTIVEAE